MGELRRGLENIRGRGYHAQAARLESWLEDITTGFADRILDFDLDCAQVWGKLMSPNPQHPIDKQIAAIALIHDLTVVTRNNADFAATGEASESVLRVRAESNERNRVLALVPQKCSLKYRLDVRASPPDK